MQPSFKAKLEARRIRPDIISLLEAEGIVCEEDIAYLTHEDLISAGLTKMMDRAKVLSVVRDTAATPANGGGQAASSSRSSSSASPGPSSQSQLSQSTPLGTSEKPVDEAPKASSPSLQRQNSAESNSTAADSPLHRRDTFTFKQQESSLYKPPPPLLPSEVEQRATEHEPGRRSSNDAQDKAETDATKIPRDVEEVQNTIQTPASTGTSRPAKTTTTSSTDPLPNGDGDDDDDLHLMMDETEGWRTSRSTRSTASGSRRLLSRNDGATMEVAFREALVKCRVSNQKVWSILVENSIFCQDDLRHMTPKRLMSMGIDRKIDRVRIMTLRPPEEAKQKKKTKPQSEAPSVSAKEAVSLPPLSPDSKRPTGEKHSPERPHPPTTSSASPSPKRVASPVGLGSSSKSHGHNKYAKSREKEEQIVLSSSPPHLLNDDVSQRQWGGADAEDVDASDEDTQQSDEGGEEEDEGEDKLRAGSGVHIPLRYRRLSRSLDTSGVANRANLGLTLRSVGSTLNGSFLSRSSALSRSSDSHGLTGGTVIKGSPLHRTGPDGSTKFPNVKVEFVSRRRESRRSMYGGGDGGSPQGQRVVLARHLEELELQCSDEERRIRDLKKELSVLRGTSPRSVLSRSNERIDRRPSKKKHQQQKQLHQHHEHEQHHSQSRERSRSPATTPRVHSVPLLHRIGTHGASVPPYVPTSPTVTPRSCGGEGSRSTTPRIKVLSSIPFSKKPTRHHTSPGSTSPETKPWMRIN